MSNVLLDHNKKNYFDSFSKAYQSPPKNYHSDSSPPNRYGSANYMQNSYPSPLRRPYEIDSVKNKYGYQADQISIVNPGRKGSNDRNSYSPIRGREGDFPAGKSNFRGEKEIRPLPHAQNEFRSFLTHLSDITTNPKKMPEIKPIAGKGLFADWMKDPHEEQVKKEQKKNEWKEYLDSQVNDKQMKKQYERDTRIAQELKDEAKFKSQFLLPEPYDMHPSNESFAQKTKDSGHYDNKGLRGYELPPIGYPARYENPYHRDYYYEQHRSMVYEEKPYISAINPVVTFTPLGNQLDMLKRDLANSQKVFGDHLRALKLEVERTTQSKMQAQKDLTVARRRDPSMDLRIKPIDILDNYINKYDLKKDTKQDYKSNLFKSQFTDRVMMRDPSYKGLEMTTGSDHVASSRGLIVGVKDQFVKITENVEMNTVDLPQKTNFLLTSVPQKRVEDQDVSIFESQVTSRQNNQRSFMGGNKSILQENLVEPGGFTEDGEWKSSPNEKKATNNNNGGFDPEVSEIHGENVFSAGISLDKNTQSYDPSLRNLGTKRGENAEKSKFMTAGLTKPDQIESGQARKLSNERNASGSQLQQQYGDGSLNMEGEQREDKKRDLVRKSNDENIMKAGVAEEDLTFKQNEGDVDRQKQKRVTTNLEK